MKKRELIELYNALEAVNNLSGLRFAYGISKNKKLLETEIQTINESASKDKNFMEYENARIELLKKHAIKDPQGNPIKNKNQFVLEDPEKFNEEFEKIRKKFEKSVNEHQEFMETEAEFKPYMINYEDLPQQITAGQLSSIIELVREPENK